MSIEAGFVINDDVASKSIDEIELNKDLGYISGGLSVVERHDPIPSLSFSTVAVFVHVSSLACPRLLESRLQR